MDKEAHFLVLAKRKLEEDLTQVIKELVENFSERYGVSPHEIEVPLLRYHRIDPNTTQEYFVGSVKVKIEV